MSYFAHIEVLNVDAHNNGDRAPPFPEFPINPDSLLFLTDCITNTDILWKSTRGTNLNHISSQILLDYTDFFVDETLFVYLIY